MRDSNIGQNFALCFGLMLTAFGAVVVGVGAAEEFTVGGSTVFGLRL